MEERIHFSAGGNASHCGIFILPGGRDIEHIVIDHIEWREGELINGVKKDAFVAIFAPNPYTKLPFVLNKVNKSRLLKVARKGEWDLLEIKNLPIRLTHEESKLGEGLRVSMLPASMPKAAVKPSIPEEKIGDAVAFLKTKSIDELKAIFTVTPDMEKRLTEKLAEIPAADGSERT